MYIILSTKYMVLLTRKHHLWGLLKYSNTISDLTFVPCIIRRSRNNQHIVSVISTTISNIDMFFARRIPE
jgi:hypothetical protein